MTLIASASFCQDVALRQLVASGSWKCYSLWETGGFSLYGLTFWKHSFISFTTVQKGCCPVHALSESDAVFGCD